MNRIEIKMHVEWKLNPKINSKPQINKNRLNFKNKQKMYGGKKSNKILIFIDNDCKFSVKLWFIM